MSTVRAILSPVRAIPDCLGDLSAAEIRQVVDELLAVASDVCGYLQQREGTGALQKIVADVLRHGIDGDPPEAA